VKAVGIRELKARLSAFLRDVERGETVLVTDRGRVIAELRAPGEVLLQESDLDRRLRQLAARVPLTVREPHHPDAYRATPVHAPEGTWRELLDEERGEA
jgi:antitoxin (DNA-binding transcriptional repressor) of toxin-antitoxin stability system